MTCLESRRVRTSVDEKTISYYCRIVYSVRVQPRVVYRVMINKNLKAKELYIVGTKKDSFNQYQDASNRALESRG